MKSQSSAARTARGVRSARAPKAASAVPVTYDDSATPYENLARTLRERGYTLTEPADFNECRFTLVTGHGVYAAMAPPGNECVYFDGRITADNVRAFDKWRSAPVSLKIPDTVAGFTFLLEKLAWVATEEGFRVSSELDRAAYVWDLPR